MKTYSYINNTDGVADVLEHGEIEDVLSILGDREKIRYAGTIKPGIKIPKEACTQKEREVYEKLVIEGKLTFDEIDVAMGGKPRSKASKLYPLNTDCFSIRANDFENPEDAKMILNKYSDKDGKVRRIPVWFPEGKIHKAVPHGYRGFGADGTVKCYSNYVKEDLVCNYISKEEQDLSVRENRKPKFTTRPCQPDICELYRLKKCRFGGVIRCNVPYVSGMEEVIIPTSSWNGLSYVISSLKRIREVLGRFSGLVSGNSFLEIRKVQENVTLPNGSKGKQWIVTIEPAVSMIDLARYRSQNISIPQHIHTTPDCLEDGETDYVPDNGVPTTTNASSGTTIGDESQRKNIIELFKKVATDSGIEYKLIFQYCQSCGVDIEKGEIARVKAIYDELTEMVKSNLNGFIAFLKMKFQPANQDVKSGKKAETPPTESKTTGGKQEPATNIDTKAEIPSAESKTTEEKQLPVANQDAKADKKAEPPSSEQPKEEGKVPVGDGNTVIGTAGKSKLFALATKKGMKIPDVKKYVKSKYSKDDVIKLTQSELKQVIDYISQVKEKAA